MSFLQELRAQRWDDHRYYHHNRINQSLHLFSACCFLSAYVLVFIDPVAAAAIGWLLAMTSRQIGHFFFEPKEYDYVNQASHAQKESIKVGYNLNRKIILLSIWGVSPLLIYLDPTLLGLFAPRAGATGFIYNLSLLWILLGVGAVLFRAVQLCYRSGMRKGLAWSAKIITDPIHDIWLYHKAPLYVMRGELYDPILTERG